MGLRVVVDVDIHDGNCELDEQLRQERERGAFEGFDIVHNGFIVVLELVMVCCIDQVASE